MRSSPPTMMWALLLLGPMTAADTSFELLREYTPHISRSGAVTYHPGGDTGKTGPSVVTTSPTVGPVVRAASADGGTTSAVVLVDFRCTNTQKSDDVCGKVTRAYESAGRRLGALLDLQAPLRVQVDFISFCGTDWGCGSSTLGQAWASAFWEVTPTPGATTSTILDAAYLYPQALLRQLQSTPTAPYNRYDIIAQFNADQRRRFWFPGDPRKAPGKGQYEFEYLALHELLHGLGYTTSWSRREGRALLTPPPVKGPGTNITQYFSKPSIFDRHLYLPRLNASLSSFLPLITPPLFPLGPVGPVNGNGSVSSSVSVSTSASAPTSASTSASMDAGLLVGDDEEVMDFDGDGADDEGVAAADVTTDPAPTFTDDPTPTEAPLVVVTTVSVTGSSTVTATATRIASDDDWWAVYAGSDAGRASRQLYREVTGGPGCLAFQVADVPGASGDVSPNSIPLHTANRTLMMLYSPADQFERGSSIMHLAPESAGPGDFLMLPVAVKGRALDVRDNVVAGAFSMSTVRALQAIGYTIRQPIAWGNHTAAASSASPVGGAGGVIFAGAMVSIVGITLGMSIY